MTQGFAKKSFVETFQRTPWKLETNTTQAWPLLEKYFFEERISYFDYFLTQRILQNHPTVSQEAVLFICHLVMAARDGHLCVQVNAHGLNPTPNQLWQEEDITPLTFEEEERLEQMLLKGSQEIPHDLISDQTLEQIPCTTPLCRYQNCFYLQRHWIFETLFLKHFERHFSSPPTFSLDPTKVQQDILTLQQKGILLPEQGEAIYNGCCYPLSLITGGPGTGKTYTAGQLIKVFWQNLSPEQKQTCEIALAAPTGKAVANLQASLGKEGFPPLSAKTLHLLLGIKGTRRPLTADFIIVDESSMIDVSLMAYLFESIKPGARLILLGDPFQLPSVEAGSLFSDLIQLKDQYGIPCVQLKTCLRTELKSIIDFAELINRGDVEDMLHTLKSNTGINHFDLPTQETLVREVSKLFPSHFKNQISDHELLACFQAMRVLSPIRKGPFGVDILNQLLAKHFIQAFHREGWLAIPIMIVTNDYQRQLFNGETGVLMRKCPLKQLCGEDYAIFPSRESKEPRRLSASLLPKYEYAYCLSVHKSQGSEFDRIVLLMPEGSELFGREVFYTAVTRARKQIDIYGSYATLSKTISLKGNRLSGIGLRALNLSLS